MDIETHPFAPFIPKGATHLILGSFPTHQRNYRFNFYYPGRANFFWRMLGEIYNRPFQHAAGEEAAAERRNLCKEKGIALSDTIYSCRRINPLSSKDSDLEVIEKMDVIGLLQKHKTIHTIILTGSSGPSSALQVFLQHLSEKNIPVHYTSTTVPVSGSFPLAKRAITFHSLYSTSGLNIGRYAAAKEQYKQCLPK